MSRGRKRLSKTALRDRRAQRWSTAVWVVSIVGAVHGFLQWWGDLAWFRLEQDQAPLVWWATSSNLPFWILGAGFLWSVVVWVLAGSWREGDRHRWLWRWGGLALVAAICVLASYISSRNGMALYEDRIAFRADVFAPLEVVADRNVAALTVSCEMVRRPRSVRHDDLIDRPAWTLVLRDGRRLRVGGVRGTGVAERSDADWLAAMRRLSHLPIRAETVSPTCVERAAARFPAPERAFVRSLFQTSS